MPAGAGSSPERKIEAVLGPLAGRVMRIVLDKREATVGEVASALAESGLRMPAYSTILTVMIRLHERGLLQRSKRGRGHVYRARTDEQSTIDSLSERAVDRLLKTYGTSAMRRFAIHLSELDDVQREELIRLAREGEDPS